ncbi:MAG: hypothetical protein K9N47_24250 [Prosthecobacter sp.]|uniref:hypothetical protein n=1 Tax=Prosthecobacter sp. TaxID=1965333 RepID=UPI00261A08B6|nr:hypothetical protein [Prosthecobacter sp.]MCF7789256.1 hypothetical protein [Prosthecobacter sp.]
MNRNAFLKLSTGTVGGLCLPGLWETAAHAAEAPVARSTAIDEVYLVKGLNAMARAHRMSSMAGHLGASLVAGYFIGRQRPDLDPEVYQGIEGDLDQVIAGESVFGSKMTKTAKMADAELFAPFPKEKSNESLIDGIAEALAKNIKTPRESGHNVIFAAIAIHALKERPEFATPSIIDGIRKLIGLFDNAHPGSGYYGKAKGRIKGNKITLPDGDDGTPPYKDVKGMVDAMLDELINQDPKVHRVGYGGLIHVNNHAAAITDLAQYGYPELVPAAVAAHHQHLRLWRNLPNVADEMGPEPFSEFNPYTAAYWTSGKVPYDRALLTHRVKTLYGFDELVEAHDDAAKEKQAYDKLRYLM